MTTLLDICKQLKADYNVFQSKDCNNQWLGVALPHDMTITALKEQVDTLLEPVGIECDIPKPTPVKPIADCVFIRVNGVSLENIHQTLDGSAEADADQEYYEKAYALLS